MRHLLDTSIVRIKTSEGGITGVGVLVGPRRALTCAHVVASALGLPDDAQEAPPNAVRLDFPLADSRRTLTARVIHWDIKRDVAGLELTDDPPDDAQPVRLVTADDLWGHHFRAFGCPSGYEDGVWVSGVLRGQTAAGWVQIEDVKEPGYWVQPGFSGTPIWDEQLEDVVGIAVAADTDRATKAAFMIPGQMLVRYWPELAERSLEAGSLEHLRMQLARLEDAQHRAADPGRFQPQIDALQERIAAWGGRVERQRERIAEGLEEQRRQRIEEQARRREEARLRVVGQPPLDVADYFKNRWRERETIGHLLTELSTRLVSVIGHGGMGKTALACKVLQDLERHHWPCTDDERPIDGIVYLSTRTAGISLERLFLDCARLLGGEEQERLKALWTNPQLENREKVSRLLESLSDGRYVILLDNLEDLLDDQGQITDDDLRLFFERALMSSQGAQLVATSRVALAFRREVMRFDRQVKLLDGLPVNDGVALLRELDPNGDYGLRDAPGEQLAEAVEMAHGVPRALEVLAGILANDPFATPDEVVKTFYEQEDVVQALIEENYKRLDREARLVIEALAVFRKPVPPLAVDYLLEPFAPGLDVPSVVQRLTRTNIVSVDRAAKTVTLHPIDQDYAYSQLLEENETETDYTRQALERHAANYYVQLRTPEETWESIEDLEPQLNEFEHRVRAGDYDDACQVLNSIDLCYLFFWGHSNRLIQMRQSLLSHLTVSYLQAENLDNLGLAFYSVGSLEKAIRSHEQALLIVRNINDRLRESRIIGRLGFAYRSLGKLDQTLECHKLALSITQEVGNRWNESLWLHNLGYTYRMLGQLNQAFNVYTEALSITQKAASQTSEIKNPDFSILTFTRAIRARQSTILGNLGLLYYLLGQFQQAIEVSKSALFIALEIGYRRNETSWYNNIASSYYALGQIAHAIQFYEEALSISRVIGHKRAESYQLLGLGKSLLSMGKLNKAQISFKAAITLDVFQSRGQADLGLAITLLYQDISQGKSICLDAINRCQAVLNNTASSYTHRYSLSTTLVCRSVCDPRWADESQRPDLLAPALEEYRRALEITAAPGVVQDAIRDLELIQAAGIEGLEPVFDLLENAEYEPDLPEDLPNILENFLQEDRE